MIKLTTVAQDLRLLLLGGHRPPGVYVYHATIIMDLIGHPVPQHLVGLIP